MCRKSCEFPKNSILNSLWKIFRSTFCHQHFFLFNFLCCSVHEFNSAQAVRGAYGVRALRNLVESTAEAEANCLRRYELAHSRQLNAETTGNMDFATPAEHRITETSINWAVSSTHRHLQGSGKNTVHSGYGPFRHAALGKPKTVAQQEIQESRTERTPPFQKYEPQKFKYYAFRKWKEIENGPEIIGE